MSKAQEEVLADVERCERFRRRLVEEISLVPFDDWYDRMPHPHGGGRSLLGVWKLGEWDEMYHPVGQVRNALKKLPDTIEELSDWVTAFNFIETRFEDISRALWLFSLAPGGDPKIYNEEAKLFLDLHKELYECAKLVRWGINEKLFAMWSETRLKKSDFVAVGSDGMRLVIWGYGHSVEEALADAGQWCEPGLELETHPITPDQVKLVTDGAIAWPPK